MTKAQLKKLEADLWHAADTLRDIMVRMVAANVHRIFFCDQADKLARVISLGDIVLRLGVEALWDTVRVEP